MVKISSRNNTNVLVVVILITITAMGTFLFTRSKYINNSVSLGTSTSNNCKQNSEGDISNVLRTYIVKKGDSLLLISKNELGDPSRYQEIAIMNGDKYPSLFSSPGVVSRNAFLEQGWILLLPPDWIKNSSGQLDIINGMIFAQDKDGTKVTANSNNSGWSATLKIEKDTVNLQSTTFKIGDCVTAVRDVRLNRVIKIDLQ